MSIIGGVARQLKWFRRSSRGGAAVELAVITPLLVLLAIGVMDYGRVFFTSIAVANAARAGSEWGAFDNNRPLQLTDIQNFAMSDAQEFGITVNAARVCKCGDTVIGSCTSSCGAYGEARVFVVVTATKTVDMLLPYPGLPSTVLISQTATFRAQ